MTRRAATGWRRPIVIALLMASTTVRSATAQQCVGDCHAHGRVSIADLILAVNVVLGLAPLDQCAVLGPAPVSVARLIASVNNALCACQPCPSPPPTRTATATPAVTATATVTATPTASPTPAPIVSVWHEDHLQVPMSTCPRQLTDQLRQGIANASSDLTVRQSGDHGEIEDDGGNVLSATFDPDGTAHAHDVTRQSQGACVVTLVTDLSVDLSRSPATAQYAATVGTAGCPTSVNCRLQITSRWTRTSAPQRGRAGALEALRRLARSM